jgi:hypothetical protein
LPNPRSVLERVCEFVREGASVVVVVPKWHVGGFESACREMLRDEDLGELACLTGTERDARPLDEIRSYFPEEVMPRIASAAELARSCALRTRAIFVRCGDRGRGSSWSRFLEQFSAAARNVDPHQRPSFIVEFDGAECEPPADDVALRAVRCDTGVERMDLVLFAMQMASRRASSPIERQLHANLVSELARFDVRLAAELSEMNLSELAELPLAYGEAFATARGWSVDTPESWELGTKGDLDGNPEVHLFHPATVDGGDSMARAVWRAQVTVLYPLLERKRMQLIREHKNQLRLPHKKRFGDREIVINDAYELELGDLLSAIRGRRTESFENELRTLVKARNDLAHYRSLDIGTVRAITSA